MILRILQNSNIIIILIIGTYVLVKVIDKSYFPYTSVYKNSDKINDYYRYIIHY